MTVASLVILTSSPHIWNTVEIKTGVDEKQWEEMTEKIRIEDDVYENYTAFKAIEN